jgi:hypothetical protein
MSSQSMSGKTNYNTDPNHIYYNLQLFNNDTVGASNSTPVRFQETRTSTILANPSEYFLSIQRFHIDTPSLPVFMPEVETSPIYNPTQDPDQLIYQVALYPQLSDLPPLIIPIKYVGKAGNTFNKDVRPPSRLDVNALSNPYYFVSEFQDFLDMINLSISRALALQPETSGFSVKYSPYFTLTSGNRFQIYLPQGTTPTTYNTDGSINQLGSALPIYSSSTNDTNGVKLVMAFNSPLHSLFSSFSYTYINSLNNLTKYLGPILSDPKQTNGWYQLVVNPANPNLTGPALDDVFQTNFMGLNFVKASDFPFLGNNFPYGGFTGNNWGFTPNSFQILTQPYSSAPLWSCVKQMIFTTALMPVNNELVGLPGVINSNNALDTDVQNNNFSPVITDLEVPLVTGDEIKPSISYSPNGEYRLIDLMSNTPINSIEISVFWKDQYGVLHPFVLEPGCFSSLKILFRRKIFNLIYLPEYSKALN